MTEPEVRISTAPEDHADLTMQGDETADPVSGEIAADAEDEAPEEQLSVRTTFVDYLKSPIITLLIGDSQSQTTLTAHQALLTRSPFFASSISSNNTTISLPDANVDATSAVLEYLYTGEYFPHKLNASELEKDPSLPKVDGSGDQLLRHAKVYTLAEKLGLPQLRALAHSKIHLVDSTAIAELAYAKYVYSNTEKTDITIRKPVASFWGQRSHVLRHETEGSFREMCLAFPEFAFDVLSHVLDAEEKREEKKRKSFAGDDGPSQGSGRKRLRG